MLSWLKGRSRKALATATGNDSGTPQGYGMSQAFLALHTYLKNRYANVVVLTFAQVEDLLGAPLPAPAKGDLRWWNGDDVANFEHSNSWRLANRTAVVNLMAQTVVFERA
jgi:hypothetical protein